MTTEKKATDLIKKFGNKKLAAMCVDEIINSGPNNPRETPFTIEWWLKVKEKIQLA